jgi:hypothetical protein
MMYVNSSIFLWNICTKFDENPSHHSFVLISRATSSGSNGFSGFSLGYAKLYKIKLGFVLHMRREPGAMASSLSHLKSFNGGYVTVCKCRNLGSTKKFLPVAKHPYEI